MTHSEHAAASSGHEPAPGTSAHRNPGAGQTVPSRPPVTVVTDSAASLPGRLVSALGVVVVPMSVVLDGVVHPDDGTTVEEVLDRSASQPVSTSAPSPGAFAEAIEQHASPGGTLVVTVSANMSSSYESAYTAAGYPAPGPVRVLDSGTAAGGQGLVVLAAARAAAGGASLQEVEAAARHVAGQVRLVAALESLDQLARSGRVPGLAAWAGRSLGVRPMFEFRNGEVHASRPAFSRAAAFDRLVGACLAEGEKGGRLHAAVLHADAADEASRLAERLCSAAEGSEVLVAPFSTVMLVHTGRGLVGVAWWWERELDAPEH